MTTDKYVFFFGGVFSQWYQHDMVIADVTYNCAEQYMMAMKAKTFNDTASLANIMASDNPSDQKAYGREVKDFNPTIWNLIARDVVYEANMAKFSGDLKQQLLDTGNLEIVEASPTDKIWGIGLGMNNLDILDKSKWQGTNWLGEAIMAVRRTIREQDGITKRQY